MTIELLKSVLLTIWSYPGVSFICLSILLNFALALAVALRTSTFSFRILGEFLVKQLAPYVIVYFVFSLAGDGVGMAWVGPAVWVMIQTMLIASIVEKLGQLGVPIPATAMKLLRRPEDNVTVLRAECGESGESGETSDLSHMVE